MILCSKHYIGFKKYFVLLGFRLQMQFWRPLVLVGRYHGLLRPLCRYLYYVTQLLLYCHIEFRLLDKNVDWNLSRTISGWFDKCVIVYMNKWSTMDIESCVRRSFIKVEAFKHGLIPLTRNYRLHPCLLSLN